MILPRAAWPIWQGDDAAAARALCETCSDDLVVDRTLERWGGRPDAQADLFG